jgi:hypothetical protein
VDEISPAGVVFRGLNLESFDEWTFELLHEEPGGLGLATMFVPLARVERIFVDEPVGAVESYRQRFEKRVGRTVEAVLGLPERGLAE